MNTLNSTTQLGGFNQLTPTRQPIKLFTYSAPQRHEEYAINTLFSLVTSHNGTTAVELIVGTKNLLTDVYAIGPNSGLNIANVLQHRFRKHGI